MIRAARMSLTMMAAGASVASAVSWLLLGYAPTLPLMLPLALSTAAGIATLIEIRQRDRTYLRLIRTSTTTSTRCTRTGA